MATVNSKTIVDISQGNRSVVVMLGDDGMVLVGTVARNGHGEAQPDKICRYVDGKWQIEERVGKLWRLTTF